jgi:hypothetical protein
VAYSLFDDLSNIFWRLAGGRGEAASTASLPSPHRGYEPQDEAEEDEREEELSAEDA